METMKPFDQVRTVLIVLSSKAMSFDLYSLKNFVTQVYQDAVVFFVSTTGDAVGVEAPSQVDLVIDLTPPAARQGLGFARAMKSRSRYQVGRDSGWFYRKKYYTRIYDEFSVQEESLPTDLLVRERVIQKQVLKYAGLELRTHGGVRPDMSHEIGRPFLSP